MTVHLYQCFLCAYVWNAQLYDTFQCVLCSRYQCVLCIYVCYAPIWLYTYVWYVQLYDMFLCVNIMDLCMLQLLMLTPLHVVFIRKKSSKWAVNLGRPPSPSKVAAHSAIPFKTDTKVSEYSRLRRTSKI